MAEILLASAVFSAIVLGLVGAVVAARRWLVPEHPITVLVNGAKEIGGVTGHKLLGALVDAGINVPSGCGGAGTCGLCQVTLLGDVPDPLPTERAKLNRSALRDGVRLACQLVLRGDVSVEVPEDLLHTQAVNCRVRSTRHLTAFIKEIVLDLPDGASMDHRPGGFVQITAPAYSLLFADLEIPGPFEQLWKRLKLDDLQVASGSSVSRAYSLANRPEDAGTVVLNIRLALPPPGSGAPPGIVSSYAFSLKPGDEVSVAGPYGTFAAQPTEREMVFIGGGAGMAPLRAIIFDELEGKRTTRKMSYWYGARSEEDIFYGEDFDKLAAKHENFTWTVALSDTTSPDWQGPQGFIHQVVLDSYLGSHPAPGECEYYLCGPPVMVRAVFSMLDSLGVDRSRIFFDDFGS